MKTAVIYQSKYGATELYAKWLAQELDAVLLKADQVKPEDLDAYQTIVYGGGIYVGKVSGIALLTKNLARLKGKSLYLFAVGASDMSAQESVDAIRNAIKQALPPALWMQMKVYCLRGRMQYSKMGVLHRTMMRMMVKMLRKKPSHALRADEQDMIAAFGEDVDFTDRAAIAPMVADIKAGVTPQ